MGDTRVVAWSGNVDARTAPTLAQDVIDVLTADGVDAVVIDLGGVTVLDSTGLGALVQVSNEAGDLGKAVTLRSTPTTVRRLLARVGLAQVFDLDGPASGPEASRTS